MLINEMVRFFDGREVYEKTGDDCPLGVATCFGFVLADDRQLYVNVRVRWDGTGEVTVSHPALVGFGPTQEWSFDKDQHDGQVEVVVNTSRMVGDIQDRVS